MSPLLELLYDWRFAGMVLFLGSAIGRLLYRFSPMPKGSTGHAATALQAHLASRIADDRGAGALGEIARLVGTAAGLEVQRSLKRQRRQFLVIGLFLGVVLSILLNTANLFSVLPGWLYGLISAVGAYRSFSLWT